MIIKKEEIVLKNSLECWFTRLGGCEYPGLETCSKTSTGELKRKWKLWPSITPNKLTKKQTGHLHVTLH